MQTFEQALFLTPAGLLEIFCVLPTDSITYLATFSCVFVWYKSSWLVKHTARQLRVR